MVPNYPMGYGWLRWGKETGPVFLVPGPFPSPLLLNPFHVASILPVEPNTRSAQLICVYIYPPPPPTTVPGNPPTISDTVDLPLRRNKLSRDTVAMSNMVHI